MNNLLKSTLCNKFWQPSSHYPVEVCASNWVTSSLTISCMSKLQLRLNQDQHSDLVKHDIEMSFDCNLFWFCSEHFKYSSKPLIDKFGAYASLTELARDPPQTTRTKWPQTKIGSTLVRWIGIQWTQKVTQKQIRMPQKCWKTCWICMKFCTKAQLYLIRIH